MWSFCPASDATWGSESQAFRPNAPAKVNVFCEKPAISGHLESDFKTARQVFLAEAPMRAKEGLSLLFTDTEQSKNIFSKEPGAGSVVSPLTMEVPDE
jgi:hypothetical protein